MDREDYLIGLDKDLHYIITEIFEQYSEDDILDRICDQMLEYVDPDVCDEEFDGDILDAYEEVGRGEAESDVLSEILAPYRKHIGSEDYHELWITLCNMLSITTN